MLSRRWVLAAGLAPAQAAMGGQALAATPASPSVALLGDRGELVRSAPAAAVQSVILAGYASAGDGGGAQYRRVAREPAHPGKVRSADGAWWALSEPRPTPEMFGAQGTYDSDTPALQACCDFVRANYVYVDRGAKNQNAVYLSARGYYVNRSIDFTDAGDLFGLALIGAGPFGSIIWSQLSSPLPTVDMSGVPEPNIEGVAIMSGQGDQSSCMLLLANVEGTNQHNNQPYITNCFFHSQSKSCVSALILQGCDDAVLFNVDATSTTSVGFSYGTGVPALYHGYAVGSGSTATSVQLNVSGDYDNDPAGLGPAVVGMLVSVNLGTASLGSGGVVVRTITGYDALTHTISWSGPLAAKPDNSTRLAILAVKSAYRTLSNLPDNTACNFTDCYFVGTIGMVLRSQGSATASRCYFTSIAGTAPGVVVFDDYLFQKTEHVVQLIGGCRWENEAANTSICAFVSYGVIILLELDGVVSINAPGGAQIATARGGSIENVSYFGACDNVTPLFRIHDERGRPASIKGTVHGVAKYDALGTVQSVGFWTLQNIGAADFTEAIGLIVRNGYCGRFNYVPVPVKMAGVAGNVTHVVELQAFMPAAIATSGGASRRRWSWTIPANALLSDNIVRRFRFEAAGSCTASMTGFNVQLNQSAGALSGPVQGGAITSGASWAFEFTLQHIGHAWSWSGALYDGAATVARWAANLPEFSSAAPITIDLFENAAVANATSVVTSLGQLS